MLTSAIPGASVLGCIVKLAKYKPENKSLSCTSLKMNKFCSGIMQYGIVQPFLQVLALSFCPNFPL